MIKEMYSSLCLRICFIILVIILIVLAFVPYKEAFAGANPDPLNVPYDKTSCYALLDESTLPEFKTTLNFIKNNTDREHVAKNLLRRGYRSINTNDGVGVADSFTCILNNDALATVNMTDTCTISDSQNNSYTLDKTNDLGITSQGGCSIDPKNPDFIKIIDALQSNNTTHRNLKNQTDELLKSVQGLQSENDTTLDNLKKSLVANTTAKSDSATLDVEINTLKTMKDRSAIYTANINSPTVVLGKYLVIAQSLGSVVIKKVTVYDEKNDVLKVYTPNTTSLFREDITKDLLNILYNHAIVSKIIIECGAVQGNPTLETSLIGINSNNTEYTSFYDKLLQPRDTILLLTSKAAPNAKSLTYKYSSVRKPNSLECINGHGVYNENGDGVYGIYCNGHREPMYCLRNINYKSKYSYDQTNTGGDWMLLAKINDGDGWQFESKYWNVGSYDNAFDLDNLNLQVTKDTKYPAFDCVPVKDIMVIFLIEQKGGHVPATLQTTPGAQGWIWIVENWFYGGSATALQGFGTSRDLAVSPTQFDPDGFNTGLWSSQNVSKIVFNGHSEWQRNHIGWRTPNDWGSVKFGFVWNNENDLLSNDAWAGLGGGQSKAFPFVGKGNFGAGDYYGCCGKAGTNKSVKALLFGR